MIKIPLIVAVSLLLIVSGCTSSAPTSIPTPTATPIAAITNIPPIISTPTSIPTPTAIPVATVVPTTAPNTSKVVLMDFFAEWCGPCKTQDPILEQVKKKFEDKVEFRKVDVDTNPELAAKYKINSIPTLIIEKDGAVLKQYTGVTSANVLEADLNAALK